ncbi:hypothetical protein [Glutamicibacter arilaitensis]|uniref:hypothetical protein n=1 Tax=Glutamicibacter arilaitensis TaxID=256701 RepID=UPI003FD4E35F
MNTCGTIDCEAPAQDKYLCQYHVESLQEWIDKIPNVLPELDDSIARTDNVRPGNPEGGNGTKSAGSSAPLNIDAMQLKINLASITENAEHYAKDQHAAGIAGTIQDWYTKAELIVSGPPEDKPAPWVIAQHREKLEGHFPEPLPPRECATWLRQNAGIKINAGKINDWHRRGKIRKHPGSTPKKPLYAPKEVLTVHLTRQHE